MDSTLDELRAAIYSTGDERKRFRQLVVNISIYISIDDVGISPESPNHECYTKKGYLRRVVRLVRLRQPSVCWQ
jgi:hypothetical protein